MNYTFNIFKLFQWKILIEKRKTSTMHWEMNTPRYTITNLYVPDVWDTIHDEFEPSFQHSCPQATNCEKPMIDYCMMQLYNKRASWVICF